MTFLLLFKQMIKFFLIMSLGFLMFKIGFMDREFNKKLSKILLNITLPALILNSVLSQTSRPDGKSILYVFLIAALMYLLLPILGIAVSHFFPVPQQKKSIYAFMTAYGNIGFMGFPIIGVLYGTTAILYTAIFNILFNLSAYTIGTLIMTGNSNDNAKMNVSHLMNPGFLISLFSILVYFINPSVPEVLADTISTIGNVTTPLSMILIGSTLATNNIREIFQDKFVYVFACFRQILLPLISLAFIHLFIHDNLILNVTFILMLMPAANSAVMFATEYHADERLASKGVFITTLLSIITIPLGVFLFV